MSERLVKVGKDFQSENINFIYNRFDLWMPTRHFDTWRYETEDQRIYFQVSIVERTAYLGIWLMEITDGTLKNIIFKIFHEYSNVEKIEYVYSVACIGGNYSEHNSYQIDLPDQTDEIDKRLSSKGRYNMKRQLRLFEEQYGEIEFRWCEARDAAADWIWDAYFSLKKESHGTLYNMSPDDYCDRYHVTDIYYLQVGKDKVVSMILSCEQCNIVYIENLAYDKAFSKFSPGQLLYNWYLKELVRKKKTAIYLGGGNYEYKERYDSKKTTVYDGTVYRNNFIKKKIELKIRLAHVKWYQKLSMIKSKLWK